MMIHHWGAMFFWTLVTRRINNPFKKAIRATARPDLFGNLFGIHPWQEAEAWKHVVVQKKDAMRGIKNFEPYISCKAKGGTRSTRR